MSDDISEQTEAVEPKEEPAIPAMGAQGTTNPPVAVSGVNGGSGVITSATAGSVWVWNGSTSGNWVPQIPAVIYVGGTISSQSAFIGATCNSGSSVQSPVQSSVKDQDGCKCCKCDEWYPYGRSNQLDGTLICYACRNNL